jgi:hypothetical protein
VGLDAGFQVHKSCHEKTEKMPFKILPNIAKVFFLRQRRKIIPGTDASYKN